MRQIGYTIFAVYHMHLLHHMHVVRVHVLFQPSIENLHGMSFKIGVWNACNLWLKQIKLVSGN